MKKLTVGLAVALPLFAAAAIPAAATTIEVGPKIEIRDGSVKAPSDAKAARPYIVTLSEDADPLGVTNLLGVSATQVFDNALLGFAARLTEDQVALLRGLPSVLAIERDHRVRTAEVDWGLDRLDQRSLPLDGRYSALGDGAGVTAYLIDSGIDPSVADLQGRARNVFDALGDDGRDCNGHGTHVAGIVGGAEYGVAKATKLRGLRVLDCNGEGWTSDVIAALDWIAGNARKPAVANLSLSGPRSKALNNTARQVVRSGVYLTVAAGNNSKNACTESPASTRNVLTVAATDQYDYAADFSNYGRCVDLYAPGDAITSDWVGGGTQVMSGTSMAAPHAVGAAALYKSTWGDASAAEITEWILSSATEDTVVDNPAGTPDRLLNVDSM
ncbi:MAG: S8 family serine peptidase [Streptosporangiales bacterium]|nr:S8 family serine peptidase [Streptosporangiales bacterium]